MLYHLSQPLYPSNCGLRCICEQLEGGLNSEFNIILLGGLCRVQFYLLPSPPPGYAPGDLHFFSFLAVYSPPPGTHKETIPHPWPYLLTTNTLFCVQNMDNHIDFHTITKPDILTRTFYQSLLNEGYYMNSIKKNMNTTLKKKTEEKSLTALAYGWRVKKCSSPHVLF